MKDIYYKIHSLLKSAKGKPLSYNELYNSVSEDEKPRQNRGKKSRRVKAVDTNNKNRDLINDILIKLQELDLVKLEKEKIIPLHPFILEGRISINRAGNAFLQIRNGKEVFIWQENKADARHRDTATAELISFRRGRFEAKIREILRPFTDKYFARLMNDDDRKPKKSKKNKTSAPRGYVIIQLVDLPDSPLGAIAADNAPENADMFLTVSPAQSSVKVRHEKFGYIQVPLYEVLSVYSGNELGADLDRIALKFSLPYEHNKDIIPAKKALKNLETSGLKDSNRHDLRKLYTITIDGDDAKDFDDAISLQKTPTGYVMYVHIADVTHYVERGSKLEQEAIARGNSYYLTTKVIPMLPRILSEEFCSLKPETKRLAFTAELHYDQNYEITKTDFYKSVIYIDKRFTYSLAEKALEKDETLREMWNLARNLLKIRLKKHRVDLNLPEVSAVLDKKKNFTGIARKTRLNSHRLIEEFMLSANEAVAEFAEKNSIPMPHRNHEKIPEKNLDRLNLFLHLYGKSFRFQSTAADQIDIILKKMQNDENETIFHYLLLRCFSPAYYSTESLGHWGLAFRHYTHFTSPIRRIADLAVHRQLAAFLNKEKYPYSVLELEDICLSASKQERLAMEAERSMMRLLSVRMLQGRKGEVFEGWISGISPAGLFVTLHEPMVEGMIPAIHLSRKGELNPIDDFRVVIPSHSITVSLGMPVQIQLTDPSWEKMQLQFDLISVKKWSKKK